MFKLSLSVCTVSSVITRPPRSNIKPPAKNLQSCFSPGFRFDTQSCFFYCQLITYKHASVSSDRLRIDIYSWVYTCAWLCLHFRICPVLYVHIQTLWLHFKKCDTNTVFTFHISRNIINNNISEINFPPTLRRIRWCRRLTLNVPVVMFLLFSPPMCSLWSWSEWLWSPWWPWACLWCLCSKNRKKERWNSEVITSFLQIQRAVRLRSEDGTLWQSVTGLNWFTRLNTTGLHSIQTHWWWWW